MAELAELHPVVEAPWFEGAPPWPWSIADREPFSFIRLSGDMAESDVGSVMAQLVKYNQVETEPTVDGLLSGAIAAESLVLPGGIEAADAQGTIPPSCCCGLEGWRTWAECLASGQSPWMGHDPTPRIEWAGDAVRVWSDGGFGNVTDAFAIEFERDRFVAELDRVGRELRAFLTRVGEWAEAVGFSDPPALCRALDARFGITGPVVLE